MPNLKSFTALDFETMTAERTSACAVGLVKVQDGVVVKKYYSLFKPIPDNRKQNNSQVNGITPQMVENAQTFDKIWPVIGLMIGDDPIVCHNAPFDESILAALLSHYGLGAEYLQYARFICTYELTGLPLEECCRLNNIPVGEHHDALDDALACARLMLSLSGFTQASTFKGGLSAVEKMKEAKKYGKDTLKPLDEEKVENKETPFFKARTVITGVFEAYPNRDELGRKLKELGADINTSISKKTNIVVVGAGAGPAKIRKIDELRQSGVDIRIIGELELISIIG